MADREARRAERQRERAELLADDEPVEVVAYQDKKTANAKARAKRGGPGSRRAAASVQNVEDVQDIPVSPQGTKYAVTGDKSASQYCVEMDEMDQEALRLARDSAARTKQALGRAAEAREIGTKTNAKLRDQTVQMENINGDLVHAYDVLDQSEQVLDQMRRPFLHKIIPKSTKSSKKAKLKGTQRVPTSVVELKPGEEYNPDAHNQRRDDLLNGGKDKGTPRGPMTVDDELTMLEKQQDDDIDQIGSVVSDLKGLAMAMNNELEVQTVMLDDIEEDTAQVTSRIKKNDQKARDLYKKPKRRENGPSVGAAGAGVAAAKMVSM